MNNFKTDLDPTSIAFIDPSVPDYETLVNDILPSTAVVILKPQADAIAQITKTLAQYHNIQSVNIISHGRAGELDFSSSKLNLSSLSNYTGQLQAWQKDLAPDADILLYGCNIAATKPGQSLVQALANLTKTNVAASTDVTGGQVVGGNWNLEYSTGPIQPLGIFNPSVAGYKHRLDTLIVTNTNDSGTGSLRDQIAAAAPGDTIVFDTSGIFATPQTITLASNLTINQNLTIAGTGSSELKISGNKTDRVLNISGSGVTVNLSDLTITEGKIAGTGANIWVTGGSTLTLNQSTVSNGTASGTFNGGGIAIDNNSNATITNSTISGNLSNNYGGGIYNKSSKLTITNSSITDNSGYYGSGIANRNSASMTITNSTINNNNSSRNNSQGGGIYNTSSTLNITNSTISGNSVKTDGGGIYNRYGNITVTNSIIHNNTGTNGKGAGAYNNQGTLSLTNSTISNNSAGNNGGGISSNNTGTLTLNNSTINANSAHFGGGISTNSVVNINNSTISNNLGVTGGAINNNGGTLTLTNSTISGNNASFAGAINNLTTATIVNSTISGNNANFGGGIYNEAFGTVSINHSTISGNSAINGGGLYQKSNANSNAKFSISSSIIAGDTATNNSEFNSNGLILSQGNNLFGQNSNGGIFSSGIASDITFSGPINTILSPLANNGGLTQTQALVTGSKAIDTGKNPVATSPTSDQRGLPFPRKVGNTIDIGAFEYSSTPPTIDLGVNISAPAYAMLGDPISYQITVTNYSTTDSIANINLADIVPSEIPDPTFTASSGNYNNSNGEWSDINLGPGSQAGLTISGTIDFPTGCDMNLLPVGGINITNTVTVAPNPVLDSLTNLAVIDPVTSNNSASISTYIGTSPTISTDNQILGTVNNDTLIGTNSNDEIRGYQGNDLLIGGDGNDAIYGGVGSLTPVNSNLDQDTIYGNQGNDYINGGEGNDLIYAGQGNDVVNGGKDNDLIFGDLGNDTLLGDLGNDTIYGGTSDPTNPDLTGDDLIYGGAGDDLLFGNQGNDSLSGGDGNDTIHAGQGDDIVEGDAGDDLLYGDRGNDTICGCDGNDTLFGGNGSSISSDSNNEQDLLYGGNGNDLIYGNEGNDTLYGDSGNDTLYGGKGDDILIGGDGDDVLSGDLGNDTLTGGPGRDKFIIQGSSGADVITDFTQYEDLLCLKGGLQFSQLSFIQSNQDTLIKVKATNELLATLLGVQATTLKSTDFILV